MYRRLVLIIAAILCLGIGAATGYGLFWLYRVADPTLSKGGTIVGIVFIGLTAMAIIPPLAVGPVRKIIAGLTYITIRKGTEKVVKRLGRKSTP
jgi:hypothetical protein